MGCCFIVARPGLIVSSAARNRAMINGELKKVEDKTESFDIFTCDATMSGLVFFLLMKLSEVSACE